MTSKEKIGRAIDALSAVEYDVTLLPVSNMQKDALRDINRALYALRTAYKLEKPVTVSKRVSDNPRVVEAPVAREANRTSDQR